MKTGREVITRKLAGILTGLSKCGPYCWQHLNRVQRMPFPKILPIVYILARKSWVRSRSGFKFLLQLVDNFLQLYA